MEENVTTVAMKSRDFVVRMLSNPHRFEQKDIEIQVDDTVTWINQSGVEHTATADSDSAVTFPEIVLAGGKFSTKVKFGTAGLVKYHCARHSEMTATITVK